MKTHSSSALLESSSFVDFLQNFVINRATREIVIGSTFVDYAFVVIVAL